MDQSRLPVLDRKGLFLHVAGVLGFLVLFSCSHDLANSTSRPPAGPASHHAAQTNPGVKCTEDSPERRGDEGCTVLANRLVAGSLTSPVYWHIDSFDSLETAKDAAGPDGVAAEAHGGVWLMTVEAQTEHHHGGRHVAAIGPLPIGAARRYSMRVQSSMLMPGSSSPVHSHPGPEVLYVVNGEQCTETPEAGRRLSAGESYVVPGGGLHRGRAVGSIARRMLALNLYDSARPVSHDLVDPPPLTPCR